MMSTDDDALRWDGDDDPTLDVTPEAATPDKRPAADQAPDSAPADAAETPRAGNVALIAYGVLGGVYALWTVGWVLGAGRVRDWILAQPGSVPDPMFHASTVLAIAAPAIWFAATLLLTRAKPVWLRFVALALGALVLVPWPFVTVGVIGS